MLDNKYVKIKLCCQCGTYNQMKDAKCHVCGLLMVDEITIDEYQAHIYKLQNKRKEVEDEN